MDLLYVVFALLALVLLVGLLFQAGGILLAAIGLVAGIFFLFYWPIPDILGVDYQPGWGSLAWFILLTAAAVVIAVALGGWLLVWGGLLLVALVFLFAVPFAEHGDIDTDDDPDIVERRPSEPFITPAPTPVMEAETLSNRCPDGDRPNRNTGLCSDSAVQPILGRDGYLDEDPQEDSDRDASTAEPEANVGGIDPVNTGRTR